MLKPCLLLAAVLGLGGCAVTQPKSDELLRTGPVRSCVKPGSRFGTPTLPMRTSHPASAEAHVEEGFSTSVQPLPGFSPIASQTAAIIGAYDALRQMSALEARAATGRRLDSTDEIRFLSMRQNVMDLILRAMLDVSSVLSEINCENERGDQLRDYLAKLESHRMRNLSVGSILVGAVTAVLSGGLSLAHPGSQSGNVAALIGGSLEASIGVAGLATSETGTLSTQRNLMRDVWENPTHSTLFPPALWRYMHSRVHDVPGAPTEREVLIAEWRTGDRLGAPGSPQEAERAGLFFGSGGVYSIDDLNTRDSLLDLLESTISVMNQDLRTLLDELMARQRPGNSATGTSAGARPRS